MGAGRYELMLDRRVRQLLDAGASRFEDLCRGCQGAFPTEVAASLCRIGPHAASLTAREPVRLVAPDMGPYLPEPHPIDYEWRFSRATAAAVARYAERIGGRVACLGVPTVFIELRPEHVEAVLIDRNP